MWRHPASWIFLIVPPRTSLDNTSLMIIAGRQQNTCNACLLKTKLTKSNAPSIWYETRKNGHFFYLVTPFLPQGWQHFLQRRLLQVGICTWHVKILQKNRLPCDCDKFQIVSINFCTFAGASILWQKVFAKPAILVFAKMQKSWEIWNCASWR